MTDHHDFGDHHYDDDPLPFDDHAYHEEPQPFEDPHDDLPDFSGHEVVHEPDDAPYEHAEVSPLETYEPHVLPADAGNPDLTDYPVEVFPPSLDVGELPEPVDGFPWVDSGSLGLADIAAAVHEAGTTDPVQPHELAEYAATDLPPGADPWAALTASDDPATGALARWWGQNH
jgi:hypothetical protein